VVQQLQSPGCLCDCSDSAVVLLVVLPPLLLLLVVKMAHTGYAHRCIIDKHVFSSTPCSPACHTMHHLLALPGCLLASGV
jgi:hypothetical protein